MKKLSLVSLLITLLAGPAFANGPLRSIIVFGNEKTERQTILSIIGIPPQTYVNERLLREVDDRLTHSGLFKTVKVMKVMNPDGTADLRVNVVEKQLWFVFPVFQAWSGRYSGGAVFGERNLFFPGGGTVFLLQGGNKLNRIFAAFEGNNLWGSAFTAKTWAMGKSDDVPIYNGDVQTDEINMKEATYVLTPGYEWTNDIQTAVGFRYSRVVYGQSPSVALSGIHGNDVSIEFNFTYDNLKRREAFLKGQRLKASYEFADTRFGTDFKYHIEEVSWEQAIPLLEYLNYVGSVTGRIGDNLPFHREFTLGGSSLRGFSERQFRGDTEIVARQDMLARFYRHKRFSVFGSVFYDLGFLYTDATGVSRNSLNNGVGGGLRISLADVIAPVFGLDAGYGIEDNAFHLYAALGLVEF